MKECENLDAFFLITIRAFQTRTYTRIVEQKTFSMQFELWSANLS